jgi:lysophospholipid acyltransferase (LPLAT)-like uncharacterized protein
MSGPFRRMTLFCLYLVALPIVFLYHRTCRMDHSGPLPEYLEGGKPFLMTWWHQDMLFNYAYLTRWTGTRKFGTLASRSEDGEIASYLLIKHLFKTFRGSSSRGGPTALKDLIAFILNEGASGIIVSDGPRPPARVAKIGIVALARETGLSIVMVRSWASRQFIFRKSWPKLALVFPFSTVRILSAGPLTVPREATKEELESYRRQVEDGLNRLALESERPFV